MYHYSLNGQQAGPISEDQLRQMVASGALPHDSLIWREGMAEWKPYSTVLGPNAGVAVTPTGAVQCAVCKQAFPADQTIRYGESNVCAACKPTFLQRLREGVADGSNNATLYAIAVNQRRVILCFGILLLCNIGQVAMATILPILAPILMIGSLVTMVVSIVFVYRLAKALGYIAIIYAIAMVIPCISLITLLVIVSRATNTLKKAGIKVGFFGVSSQTIEQLKPA